LKIKKGQFQLQLIGNPHHKGELNANGNFMKETKQKYKLVLRESDQKKKRGAK